DAGTAHREDTPGMKENQNIEWKKSWRDEYIKWICGFANAAGGTLVIGKNNKGVVTGVDNAKKLLADIPNKVRDILGIIVDVNLKTDKSKDFLEIVVDPYPYPVSYKGQYHYRSGSTKQELKGAALNAFLLKKYGLHWDGVPVPNLSPESLEEKAFELFAGKAVKSRRLEDSVLLENRDVLLRKLHLVEGPYLKRAAALLFHEDPEQYVTGAYVKIGFFRTDSDLIYQDEIHGNLFQQVDSAIDLLLTKYMKAYISYEGIQRVERYLFPVPALREALLNAIIHKDYSSGVPIQISVYEDKIYFWNNGRLPENWTVERLLEKHSSQPFNPLIANAFFRTGLIEAWGRGIEKMLNECKQHGADPPVFDYEPSGLMLLFKGIIPESQDKDTPETTRKSSLKSSLKIVLCMKEDKKITIPEIAERIGITERGVKKQISKLKAEGKITRVGPDKGGYWKILKE
ncbi:MAG: ATP-binding protein, partial [Thermodesulfobacteriota bacterium]|nr:ATP-binding protein [Thermodesulfobacteriota bacterium]